MFVGFVTVMKTVSLEQLKAKVQALSERLLQNVSIRKLLRKKKYAFSQLLLNIKQFSFDWYKAIVNVISY